MRPYIPITQKFTQTHPATTLYYHICKFTRKRFCSPLRRCTYSPMGLLLKKEHDRLLKLAAKQVCRVYFYQCPITGRYFTTRKPGSRFAPESKAITRQTNLEYIRQYRQRPEVKLKENERNKRRGDYFKAYKRPVHRKPASTNDQQGRVS